MLSYLQSARILALAIGLLDNMATLVAIFPKPLERCWVGYGFPAVFGLLQHGRHFLALTNEVCLLGTGSSFPPPGPGRHLVLAL